METTSNGTKIEVDDFFWMYKKLACCTIDPNTGKAFAAKMMLAMSSSRSTGMPDFYQYRAAGHVWIVVDASRYKIVWNDDRSYNSFFCKDDGFNIRFGKEVDIDPEMCALGPEIADIEIAVGGCPKINGIDDCRWCYKDSSSTVGKAMDLDSFKKIIAKFPKNLSKVALGITGVKSNPWLKDILAYLKSIGIASDLTLTGADLDDEMAEALCKHCVACAVNCYDKAKELCYKTIEKLHSTAIEKFGRNMAVDMHVVLADFSIDHAMTVLDDIRAGKVPGLTTIVFLHAKPVGRAKNLDCSLSKDNLRKVVDFCLNNKISFGFDCCNGHNVEDLLVEMGKQDCGLSIEHCESARMSIHVNVDGKMMPCRFVESIYADSAIDLLNTAADVQDFWTSSIMLNSFRDSKRCSKSCPAYQLDCK